ncbi:MULTISPECIES: histidine kinase [Actinomyces]|uniref:histidine kinase n=1 Tax=Actinomyces respiraculi TaxID=2744574 RepID=A0A7T0LL15_9ACTO|nr:MULTISPECIES: histidine kinase [Actinomyces]QPL05582.1 histidine kinase [Actinomyces respiraculi]
MTQPHRSPQESGLLARLGRLPRPGWPDLIAAALLVYVSAWNLPDPLDTSTSVSVGVAGSPALFAVLVTVCALATLLRRVLPTASVLLIGLVCLIHLAAYDSLSLLVIGAGLIAVETTTSRVPRPWAWPLLAAHAVGAAVGIVLAGYRGAGLEMETARMGVLITVALVFVAAAALTGLLRRRSRERREQVRERLALLAAQQETERRLAVVEERNRIARDVHDLLGHSLSVIGMQAEGARAVLSARPEEAERALAVIGETSRRGVDDVRALVDVLRSDDDEPDARPDGQGGAQGGTAEPGAPGAPGMGDVPGAPGMGDVPGAPGMGDVPGAPGMGDVPGAPGMGDVPGAPGVDDVPGLVTGVREAGTAVTLSLAVGAATPEPVGACAYRVVQEALTNAVRHAPGAAVAVEVDVTEDRVEVTVSNTAGRRDSDGGANRGGLGLVSMTERVHAVGGTLTAGTRPDGGWRVHAVVPVSAGAA